MKPAAFDYVAAETLDEAVSALARSGGDGKILAGGQSLVPMLNFRLVRPSIIIDINRIHDLEYIDATGDVVRIGALMRHHALETSPVIKAHLPVVTVAMQHVAHLAVRNRGTIGGSLSHADPAAELPACCVALDAVIVARSATAERRIPADQFFTGLYATALGEKELIAAIEFPARKAQQRSVVLELARRSGDYAMVGVAAQAEFTEAEFADGKLVFFGVGEVPVAARAAVAVLTGRPLTGEAIAQAEAALDTDLNPPADQHASSQMRRHLARVLLGRALRRLSGKQEASVA